MLRQTPALSTVCIGTFVAPLLVEVDLVECGVKIVISMSVSCSVDFIHFARVSLEAVLYGFDIVSYAAPDLFGYIYVLFEQLHRTNILIDWKFYLSHMEPTTSSF